MIKKKQQKKKSQSNITQIEQAQQEIKEISCDTRCW